MDTAVQEIEFVTPVPTTSGPVTATMPPNPVPSIATEGATPILSMIERASRDPAVDIDKMERLILMQERMQAKAARDEFDAAMADAQEAMRAISPDKDNSQTKSKYATYAALDHAVRPIYSKHGFALSFNTGDAPNPAEVRVLCTVSHRGGHRQDYKIDMPADGKGPQGASVMTRTHATGAAASYGQRYLLKLIFNLAVGDIDDDGNGADHNDDVERLGTGPRGEDGRLMSNYSAKAAEKAKDWADAAIQTINLTNAAGAREWRRVVYTVAPGKKKSPLQWLADNSPGQFLRVKQCYQNVTGEDLE
jgi:hypothetical protein